MSIGQRRKHARIFVGMKQTDIAQALGVSSQYVYQYETDKRTPTHARLTELSLAMGLELRYTRNGVPYFYAINNESVISISRNGVRDFNDEQEQNALADTEYAPKVAKVSDKDMKNFMQLFAGGGVPDSISHFTPTADPDHAELLTYFDRLNRTGKDKAISYTLDLSENPKYTKDDDE